VSARRHVVAGRPTLASSALPDSASIFLSFTVNVLWWFERSAVHPLAFRRRRVRLL
jgi:hypothetical protein